MRASASALAHAGKIVPPVVIAEDRPGAERGVKPRQFHRPLDLRHLLGGEAVARDIVAEKDDEIRFQAIGGIDDLANVLQHHVRSAGMQIGDHGDGELAVFRPCRRRRRVTRDGEALRLDGGGVERGRGG